MDRNHLLDVTKPIEYRELVKHTVFHEAGHAAAIYLYNKSNGLPLVFFEIITKELCNKAFSENAMTSDSPPFIAKINGGRLIPPPLASPIESAINSTKTTHQQAYQADIVNLLAGSLAEAKYIALRDNESFNPLLIDVNSLKFYGGSSDLDIVYEYLDHFLNNNNEREQKLTELLNKAFLFVNDPANWKAISSLASYILNNMNKTISCEQAFIILDG